MRRSGRPPDHGEQGESAKDCTNRCVNMGGRYTLFDPATKTAYQLDDPKKAATFAGAKVAVTGTLNAATKTIHVASIKAASLTLDDCFTCEAPACSRRLSSSGL